ncbi:MAG TPA: hypothetical protein VFA12_09525 [Stellaceae bacterium]|jgi:hypothetical protein|nr:hypothetical protein [Stellaceae bacterium]
MQQQELPVMDLSQVSRSVLRLDQNDLMVAIASGGIGLLIKKLYQAMFPPPASIAEQLDALRRLIESCRAAGVKKLSVKMSQPAFAQFRLSAKDLKVEVVQEYQEACMFTVELA